MNVGQSTTWMRLVVLAAAAQNGYSAMSPTSSLELRSLWAALGIGLTFAAIDPLRYWPVIVSTLIARFTPVVGHGLLGRGPAATASMASALVSAPLSFVLASAYLRRLNRLRRRTIDILDFALRARTNQGATVDALSRDNPVLLVFLRHAGCTFCREALADLAAQRRDIESTGVTIVLAHMGKPEFGREFFEKYGLSDLHQISDPGRGLYKAFGLQRGNLWMLFGPKVWWRGFEAGILGRHGVGRLMGDGFQMPGLFMIFHGQILRTYRHQSAADRPHYFSFVSEDAFTGMIS
ncbi:MAG TPA: peroxiredoxin-like family protein [Bryobacteraceae bacterium]|nr:peroxiredoxin-like family protein [Bryobacteraceae bacterium]